MQGGQVAHRVEAQAHVVEVLVPLPVARRAAHVRDRDRVAALHEVLEKGREDRPRLGLRAAVDRDDHRPRGRRPRLVEEDGHLDPVEGGEAVQRRLDEVGRRRLPGDALDTAGGDVARPDVAGLDRRDELEREPAAVAREDELLRDASARQLHLAKALERPRVEELDPAVAVLVRLDGRHPAGTVDHTGHVPVAFEGEAPPEPVPAGDARDVAAEAGGAEEAPLVEPRGRADARLFPRRRDEPRRSGREIDEVELLHPGRRGLAVDGEGPPAGREALRLAPGARVEDEPLLARLQGTDVDVEVDAVAAVARVREQRAVAARPRTHVDEVALDDERLEPAVEEVELDALVPALVLLDQDPLGVAHVAAVHRLVERRQRLERGHAEELHRAGQIRADEEAAVGAEVRGRGDAKLEQLPEGQVRRTPQGTHVSRAGVSWSSCVHARGGCSAR